MWSYLNVRISAGLALIIVVLAAIFCVIVVRGYAGVILRDIEKMEKNIEEIE